MKPLRFKRVEIRQPRASSHKPELTTTNNKDWKQGLFIVFEDYDNNLYDWMPCWKELGIIEQQKETIEDINSSLAKLSQSDAIGLINALQVSIVQLSKEFQDLKEEVAAQVVALHKI